MKLNQWLFEKIKKKKTLINLNQSHQEKKADDSNQ